MTLKAWSQSATATDPLHSLTSRSFCMQVYQHCKDTLPLVHMCVFRGRPSLFTTFFSK